MARPALEVADILRGHGAAWRHAVSLDQLKVMSAIESCRTGGPRRPCPCCGGRRCCGAIASNARTGSSRLHYLIRSAIVGKFRDRTTLQYLICLLGMKERWVTVCWSILSRYR